MKKQNGTRKTIWRALKISFRTKSKFSLIVSLLGFAAAFLPVMISSILRDFTNQVQELSLGRAQMAAALKPLAAMVCLYVLQAVYHAADRYCAEIDQVAVNRFMEETVMDCSATVEYKYLENEGDYQERLSFIEQYGALRVAGSVNLTIKLIHYLITFITVGISMAAVDWKMVVILLAASIPAVWIASAQNDANYKGNLKQSKEAAMSVRLFYMATGAELHCKALNTVRFTGAYPWLKQKWRKVSEGFLEKKRAIAKKYLGWNILADCLRNGVFLFVLLLAAFHLYKKPELGLGVFTSVYLLARQLQTAAENLLLGGASLAGNVPYIRDFLSFQDIPKEPCEATEESIRDAEIVCRHVSFTYPNGEKEALKDIDLTIRQGEKIAIVGHNGSGKSTFVNLLCGMYEPSRGSVTIGGRKVCEALSSVRKIISVVFQNFGRYEASLRINIAVGDKERNATDVEIMELAEKTGAASIIQKQERGLSEEVGTFNEKGNDLSGGQWQKIALTRALYRKDSRIIILDEPTAALDPVAEAALYRDFAKLTGDKTTILISHRLGITAVVDRILVFDHGRIVEDGSHEELIARKGLYAKMYQAQAKWYV